MGNINSISQARKLVREAQSKANEGRVEREGQNVDDAAAFLVEQGRVAAVDEWEQNRIGGSRPAPRPDGSGAEDSANGAAGARPTPVVRGWGAAASIR